MAFHVLQVASREVARWRAQKAQARMALLALDDRRLAQRSASACPPQDQIAINYDDVPDYEESSRTSREH